MKKRDNGEGSFYKQGGRWYGKITVLSASGSPIRKTASGKTRAEAIANAKALRQKYLTRTFEKITLGEWIERWLAVYMKSKRTATKETYASLIKNHILPGVGHFLISELKPDDMSGFLADLLETLSASSVCLIYNILSAAMRQAVKSEVAYRNVMQAVDKPKIESINHQILTEKQIRAFIDRAISSQFYTAYLLLIGAGLRRGEALAARWENICFEKHTIAIVETLVKTSHGIELNQPKSKQSKRTIKLPSEIVQSLATLHRSQKGFIVSNNGLPINPDTLWADFRKIKSELGLGTLTIHELRHSHSAHLLRLNVPLSSVSRRLGHSTIKTTSDIYSCVVPESEDSAAKAMEFVLRKEL